MTATGLAGNLELAGEFACSTEDCGEQRHGLHLMALTALGATPLSEQLKLSMIALLEQQATFQKAVYKDDNVRSEFEIEGIERQSDKEWGTLRVKIRLLNHRDEIVLEGRHVYRIRGKAAKASLGAS